MDDLDPFSVFERLSASSAFLATLHALLERQTEQALLSLFQGLFLDERDGGKRHKSETCGQAKNFQQERDDPMGFDSRLDLGEETSMLVGTLKRLVFRLRVHTLCSRALPEATAKLSSGSPYDTEHDNDSR